MAPVRALTGFDRLVLACGAGLLVLLISGGGVLEEQCLIAEQERTDARKALADDREVCLRMVSGSHADHFSRCMVELGWVRAEERYRLSAGSAVWP